MKKVYQEEVKKEEEKVKDVARDMMRLHNDECEKDKSLIHISEAEMEELLEKMDEEEQEWDVSDDEQAEAWFEEKFKEIMEVKIKFKPLTP